MAELIAFKNEVMKLLKENDRCDIDASRILKVKKEITTDDTVEEFTPTPQDVYEKLIEIYPEKKCFNPCKRVSNDEFFNNC